MSENQESLEQFCQRHPQWLWPYYQLQGGLFAAAACPEIPSPERWMGAVVTAPDPLSQQQTDTMADHLMAAFKTQLLAMRDERVDFPEACVYSSDITSESPLSQWLQGCLHMHQQLEPVWQHAWHKMHSLAPEQAPLAGKNLRHVLNLFATFADLPRAKQEAEQRGNAALLEQLDGVAGGLTPALQSYVALAGQLASFLPNQFETYQAQPGKE
ncbi:hypothetical protein HMF8227_02714 [Saliniradius amylolyticus]|uniref:YecA family protein n=1 Tax=Saliniradius amylolyticus TaxID=2183582 RepID=A0A2S2E673_9ALTE|nr:UPF0149 family protein [Saliniradius amylolyticus]AWL13165.1 hypothetical protein HMF8227_02714 [Saliniradius amylolyticus]